VKSALTFINHATVLIEINGVSILTDPTYNHSVGFIAPRMQKPGIPVDQLPQIDLILISHNDYDHLSLRTLRRLRRRHQSSVCVPTGDKRHVLKSGLTNLVEMNWWDSCETGGVTVHCVPAKHKSSRTLFQRNKKLCCGYVIERDDKSVFFAGDTGYGGHFREIGERHQLDVALLPIGGYKPANWLHETHLDPHTALTAFLDLRAELFVPIHWGTFKISDEPLREPAALLLQETRRLGLTERVRILRNGESVKF
jgi:L-ascorbate metabolism protein UlaG (beta-lactamase superfamily)